jgi:hypothetical protein
MGLLLAVVAFLAGAGLILHERAKEGTLAPPLLAPSTFEGVARDHVYRLWAKLERGYGEKVTDQGELERDLSGKVIDLGFSEVLLAGEDPTDPHVWTFLARWGQDGSEGANAPPLAVYALEEVLDVPVLDASFPRPPMILDDDLTSDEAHAVAIALTEETDPVKLEAFSQAMIVDFPLAGMLLRGKAETIRLSSPSSGAP